MNTSNQHRYIIYVRKSTGGEDRQVRSIGDQLAEIRELVKRYQLDVVGSFEESKSAKTKGRPFFNQMLDQIEAGEADGIIAWHPDRLARNQFDGGRVIDLIDEGKLKDLKFCTFWFEPTAQGKLMLGLAFGQSKYYSDSLSVNIQRGQRQKVQEGIWPLRAPVGYLNEPKLRTIVTDPVKGPLVKMAFELYGSGEYTFDRLRDTMNAKGLLSINGGLMTPFRYQQALRNPFYCGVFVLKGEMHEAAHEPLVTKELFDRVQDMMKVRSKPNPEQFKPYVYRGLFKCGECGYGITMETQKGHNYLRCSKRAKKGCSQPYVREESMTQQIGKALATASLPDATASWMIQQLDLEQEDAQRFINEAKAEKTKEIEQIDKKLDRLTVAYLDAGAFSATEFRKRKAEAITKKRSLYDSLAELNKEGAERFEPLKRFINGSKQMKYAVQTNDLRYLRECIKEIGSNLKMFDRKLHWEPRGAWQLVVNQGSFAQRTTAPSQDGAVVDGETHQIATKWSKRDSNQRVSARGDESLLQGQSWLAIAAILRSPRTPPHLGMGWIVN